MANSKGESAHHKTVYKDLPKVAGKLKEEGLISGWDREQLKIELEGWNPFTVKPDLILHVPGRRKLLVEIINPDDPKRYIGEILYAHILGSFQKIGAAVFLILSGTKGERATFQQILLNNLSIRKTISHFPIYLDFTNKETVYMVLKDSVTTYRKKGSLY